MSYHRKVKFYKLGVNMRIALSVLILMSGFFASYVWACKGGGCSNSDATNVGAGCKVANGASNTTCFVSVSGMANNCYVIVNSGSLPVFIPTKTGSGAGEFQNFVTHPPAGITVTPSTAGSGCYPTCWPSTCPGVAGSAVNPP